MTGAIPARGPGGRAVRLRRDARPLARPALCRDLPLRGTWRVDRRGTGGPVCDVIALNETFASKAVAVIRDANPNPEKTNPNPYGGGIALGHPVRATGAILSLRYERRCAASHAEALAGDARQSQAS